MSKPRILAFSGSARRESFNQRLVEFAARTAEKAGADVRCINLRDFPMPIFDQDLEREHGEPENAAKLKKLMAEHSGFLIASPEYNSSVTPLLKNALDWASRKAGDESGLIAYDGKIATLLGASPGALGGIRALPHLRQILGNLGVFVLPAQVSLGGAGRAFDDNGELVQNSDRSRVDSAVTQLVESVGKLA
ncbi:MAG: NAD(P)H-dependent oxidoreductase [Woeseiaceae bacterium]|nr:NAD(P)H-dependent oxidoreductase [Woeseiaceae bacterium]